MKALVIHAHPDPDSFNRALLDRVVAGLEAARFDCDVIDLYAIDYRAELSRDEHLAYTSDSPILDPVVAQHAELLKTCDVLAFVYPTWWSSLPAILKGWVERTLVMGVAFELDERTGRLTPLLGNVRRLIGITTHGSPKWYARIITDNGRRTLTRTLRASLGVRARTTWLAMYQLDAQPESRRIRFLDRVERDLSRVKVRS